MPLIRWFPSGEVVWEHGLFESSPYLMALLLWKVFQNGWANTATIETTLFLKLGSEHRHLADPRAEEFALALLLPKAYLEGIRFKPRLWPFKRQPYSAQDLAFQVVLPAELVAYRLKQLGMDA